MVGSLSASSYACESTRARNELCYATHQLSSEQEKCAWRKGGITLSALLLRNWIYPFLSSAFWFPRICVLLSGCELAHAMQNNAAASRLVQFPCNEGKDHQDSWRIRHGCFYDRRGCLCSGVGQPKGPHLPARDKIHRSKPDFHKISPA